MNSNIGTFQLRTSPRGSAARAALPRRDISARPIPIARSAQPAGGAGEAARYLEAFADAIAQDQFAGTIAFHQDTSSLPLWLDDVYSLVFKSKTNAAVDLLFKRFNEMLSKSQFEQCDEVLKAIDLSRLDTNLLVAILSITRPASAKLRARAGVVKDVERTLRKVVPERADRLLKNLR